MPKPKQSDKVSAFITFISKKHRLDEEELMDDYASVTKKQKLSSDDNNIFSTFEPKVLKAIKSFSNKAIDFTTSVEAEAFRTVAIRAVLTDDLFTFNAVEDKLDTDTRMSAWHYATVFNKTTMKSVLKLAKYDKQFEDRNQQKNAHEYVYEHPFQRESAWLSDNEHLPFSGRIEHNDDQALMLLEAIRIVDNLTGQLERNGNGNLINEDFDDNNGEAFHSFWAKEVSALTRLVGSNIYVSAFLSTLSSYISWAARRSAKGKESEDHKREYSIIQLGHDALTSLYLQLLATPGNPLKNVRKANKPRKEKDVDATSCSSD
jgi:hypothetical protein